jgi:hypothetical protein
MLLTLGSALARFRTIAKPSNVQVDIKHATEPKRQDAAERRQVTVMFSDF